ncbi:unnamed protein product [Phytomonas sp. EM1]|nr:unnamed protein product [Phytomonas sp. EM1]|eukprot:CCW64787.1 unnamed protein product [Phytomonas sp. isolate EM1]
MMKDQELFRLIVRVLEEYFSNRNFSTTTVEEKALELLRPYDDLCSQEVIFVLDCVLGVCRFEKICEGAFEGYCDAYKRNKNGRLSIYLITYILFFKYADLGGEKVRILLRQPALATRIVEYIRYLFDLNAVQKYSFPRWLEYYDILFLQSNVLEPFTSRKSNLEADVLGWIDTSTTVPQGAIHQHASEGSQVDNSRDSQPLVKTPLNMEEGKSSVYADTKPFKTSTTSNSEPPRNYGSHQPPKFQSDKSSTTNITQLMPLPTVVALPAKQVLFSQNLSKTCSNVVATTLPIVKKKLPTRPIGFRFLKRSLHPSPHLPDAVDKKSESTKSAARISEFYARVKASEPAMISTTTTTLRREAYVNEKQQREVERSVMVGEEPLDDSVDYELWTTQECRRIAQEQKATILERHLKALEFHEKVKLKKAKTITEKRECFRSMKRKAAADASEKEKEDQAAMHRHQEFVRTFKTQLATSKSQALAKCNSNKRRAVNKIREENSQIREAAQEAEEKRRLEQSQMIHDIRLLRERIKQRQKELAKHRCATWAGDNGESTDNENTPRRGGFADVQATLAEARARKKEIEENYRKEIAATHEREREERQMLEQMIQEQRQRRCKRRERARMLDECRKQAVQDVIAASHAERVIDVYEKLHSKRLEQLQSCRELKEEERRRLNERILRNANSGAAESERWRQLEQGLHNHVLSIQNFRKGCAVSI